MTPSGRSATMFTEAESPRRFYLALMSAIALTAFGGFAVSYFVPLVSGGGPSPPATVHVHGWSFFLWYVLAPVQAALIGLRRAKLHRTLGRMSVGLAALMIVTGLVAVTVRIDLALLPTSDPFWRDFGPLTLATLGLFTLFYVQAIRHRRRGAMHKRYMVMASAAALGAAGFRVFTQLFGFPVWAPIAGVLSTNVFIVAGMLRDRAKWGRVHPVYRGGLTLALVVESVAVPVTISPVGGWLLEGLGAAGRTLRFLY